jgi:hypothetical protein
MDAHLRKSIHGHMIRRNALGCRLRSISTRAAAPEAPPDAAPMPSFEVPQRVLNMNAELAEALKGQAVLAPLTRGNHLPFRRLCMDFGAQATMSEMIFARELLRCGRTLGGFACACCTPPRRVCWHTHARTYACSPASAHGACSPKSDPGSPPTRMHPSLQEQPSGEGAPG